MLHLESDGTGGADEAGGPNHAAGADQPSEGVGSGGVARRGRLGPLRGEDLGLSGLVGGQAGHLRQLRGHAHVQVDLELAVGVRLELAGRLGDRLRHGVGAEGVVPAGGRVDAGRILGHGEGGGRQKHNGEEEALLKNQKSLPIVGSNFADLP